MTILRLLAVFGLIFCILGFCLWLFLRLRKHRPIKPIRSLVLTIAGAAAGAVAMPIEAWVLNLAHIDITVEVGASSPSQTGPILAMLLFCVPFEESLKVGILWPLYLRRRLLSGAQGVSAAVFVASGFSVGEIVMSTLLGKNDWLSLLRVALSVPAHVFFAGVWGYFLGGRGRDRFFTLSFLGCVIVHAIYDHIVFSRGPAMLVVAAPMFATMGWGVFALLRDSENAPVSSSSVYSLLDPHSRGVGRSLDGRGRSLKIQWILAGILVNLGVTLTFLATAVYFGHRFGIDFARVEEATAAGVPAILFLAGGLLASFPVSGFLVARASGTQSLLEPAWAMGASVACVLAVFSVTEPTAIVIAAGIAPVGFLMACIGALFGLRSR